MSPGEPYELEDGRFARVVAEFHGVDYVAYTLHDVDAVNPWLVTWTDGINVWLEAYELAWHGLARLAAVVAAAEQGVFLIDDLRDDDYTRHEKVVEQIESLIARQVHSFNCLPGCDGTGPLHGA